MNNNIFIQALKFFGISGLGWLLDTFIFLCLSTVLNINITVSNTISSICSVTFVFFISTRKLFINTGNINLKLKYLIYIIYELILIFSVSFLMSYIKDLLLNFDISLITNFINIIVKIIVTPFTMILNYIVMKFLIEKV